MSVRNYNYGMVPISPTILTLPQWKEPNRENPIIGPNPFLHDSKETQRRASTFFKYLEKKLSHQEGNKSFLLTLLTKAEQLSTVDENSPIFTEMTKAFFKQKGYLSRLFGGKSWKEWTENRTSLGIVAAQFRDCIESQTKVRNFVRNLDEREVQQANKEAEAVLKNLNFSKTAPTAMRDGLSLTDFHFLSPGSCAKGLIGGAVASLATKSPVPMLFGLSQCLPKTFGQQRIGDEFQVNTYTNLEQQSPTVASFSNDAFVVIWASNQDGSVFGVYGQLFDGNANKIGSEFQVNTYIIDHQNSPSVAVLENDNFVVVWASERQDGSGYGIYGQVFDGNANEIGSEFRVNTYTVDRQYSPSVASLLNNNFIVTWSSIGQIGSGNDVFAQLFEGNGTKIGNEFLVNTYTSDFQYSSSVASFFTSGNFIIVWQSYLQDGSGYGNYGQLFEGNGTKIGNEFQVNTYTSGLQVAPSAATMSDGKFVVTWNSRGQDGSGDGVYAQLFEGNGTKIGSEFPVNTYVNLEQRSPSVASFNNRNIVISWESLGQDGSDYGIYGQLFDRNGSKIGIEEFRVNSYTNNGQRESSVARIGNDNFVVIWASDGQDGNNWGVYGQIFNDFLVNSTTSSSTTTTSSTTITSSTTTISSTTTSSMTSSVSSSPTSTMTRGSTSVDSGRGSTQFASTIMLQTTSNSSTEKISTPSIPNNRLLWLWLLLGGVTGVSYLGTTVYFLLKRLFRQRKDEELSEFDQTTLQYADRRSSNYDEIPFGRGGGFLPVVQHSGMDTSGNEEEEQYQKTPDAVTAEPGKVYRRTPDAVTAGDEKVYQRTPDAVTAGDEKVYLRTPDAVTAETGSAYEKMPSDVPAEAVRSEYEKMPSDVPAEAVRSEYEKMPSDVPAEIREIYRRIPDAAQGGI